MSHPLISIITPTFGREEFLPQTLRWVQQQTYSRIEWLILDDSPVASRHLTQCSDDRIRYTHIGQRLTIGEKRNRLIDEARGELIAHFDDDDYYAPRYIETMATALHGQSADFTNLSSWYLFDVRHDLFGFWNLRQTTGLHYLCHVDGLRLAQFTPQNNAHLINNYLGYGFTYFYRRTVWKANPFAAIDWGEDMQFVSAAAAAFGLMSIHDQSALVLHVLHENSTSACFPQYSLPPFLLQILFAEHQPFLELLRRRRRESSSVATSS